MAYAERIQVLTEAEIRELYDPPHFSLEERRHYFNLNDREKAVSKTLRKRSHRCYFIALLGYFKSKPIVLKPNYMRIKQDLLYIADTHYPTGNIARFALDQKLTDRLYQKIFELLSYKRWHEVKQSDGLMAHLNRSAKAWIEPRFLFDAAIEYLSLNRIAIPKFTAIQNIISHAMNTGRQNITVTLAENLTVDLAATLAGFLDKEGILPLSLLRQSAKNFKQAELAKELHVNQQLQPWIEEIDTVISALSLSLKNRHHFASMVDYYGSKISRFDQRTQYLYLLCYLQNRAEENRERLMDGFVHHIKKIRDEAKNYAKEAAYRDWEGAANNVSKAAELLQLFIDDSIDETQPFSHIKRKANKRLGSREIQSLCLYLKKQKRAIDDYQWEFYDKQSALINTTLRPIFLCLDFEATASTTALAEQLIAVKSQHMTVNIHPIYDRRLIPKKQSEYLVDRDGNVNAGRYEWLLYLLIPNKLKGQLHVPGVVKYRALSDDLVSNTRWKAKNKLITQSMLPRIQEKPNRLMSSFDEELQQKLDHVTTRIDNGDNQNIIMKIQKGKVKWKLPSTGSKKALNNPFFEKIKPINIAEVLRYIDQETKLFDCFDHVLPVQAKSRSSVDDIVAVIIGNGTNYGVYGMAHISDRNYKQLQLTQANYVRPETLRKANDIINDATSKLPIFEYYNIQENLIHASADGQKFESRLETFRTRYSSKYFGTNKGVSSVSLVANHAAINAKIVGSNEHESHYIFDLLQSNTSDIKPDILSTDTHGVNHVNFALLDLFGYSFAPRYANVGKVIGDMFSVNQSKEHGVKMTLKKPIRTDVILEQWDTIQRIVISLQERTTTQATLVRKLSGYAKNHPLLQALTEYNRMIKAIFVRLY